MKIRTRLVLLMCLVVLGAAVSLYAGPIRESTTFYFTDATKTVQCGDREIFCSGLIVYDGCHTAWYTIYYGDYC